MQLRAAWTSISAKEDLSPLESLKSMGQENPLKGSLFLFATGMTVLEFAARFASASTSSRDLDQDRSSQKTILGCREGAET